MKITGSDRDAAYLSWSRPPGARRRYHLEPGDVREERLQAFAVVLGGTDAAEAGHPQCDGHRQGAAAAVVHPGHLADDLVHRRVGETVKLHLRDGVESGHRQAHGHAQDAGFGQRRVEYAPGAEACLQAVGDPEDPTQLAHVLAQHQGLGVGVQNLGQRTVERLLH